MNKRRLATVVIVIVVAAILVTSFPLTEANADHCHPSDSQTPKTDTNKSVGTGALNLERQPARARASNIDKAPVRVEDSILEKKPVRVETLSLNVIHSRELPMAILSISEAVKAIQSGDRQTELVELSKALNMLLTVHSALDTHVKTNFANYLRCPVMGSSINLDMVGESLTRNYKGQKVAFCCAECPAEWDKLSDAQKQAKLPKVKS